MKAICPRCKQPAKDHAPFRAFCPLKESEVLYLIIELQQKSILERETDFQRVESLNNFLRIQEWVEFGFTPEGIQTDEYNGSLTECDEVYYVDGEHYAPTLRESLDLWLESQRTKDHPHG